MKLCMRLALTLGVASAVPRGTIDRTTATANTNATATAALERRQTPEEIIDKYSEAVAEIVRYITVDEKGRAFDKLSAFCDKWGHRLQGSQIMEDAIDGHAEVLEAEGFSVSKEPCTTCPHWERGEENATLISPLIGGSPHPMKMMGLGKSIGTPPEGITAEVLVVEDFEALELVCAQAEGKIVVWNLGGWFGYGTNNAYRTGGASAAAECGAVASLTRSVTPFSLNSPHTGSMTYAEGVPQIPAAAITIEDTDLLTRMQARGQAPTVTLYMEAQNFEDKLSFNLIADLPGAEIPDEIVFMSGHMDSWDFGSGAMDDGQGWATGWTAMEAIERLTQLSGGGESPAPVLQPPKRTLRTIHWAAEEWGSQGASDYWDSGVQDSTKISLGMGDDNGAFTPTAFAFTGCDEARAIIEAIVFMLNENGIAVDVVQGGGFEGSGQVPDVP